MKNYRLNEFKESLISIVGKSKLLTDIRQTSFYSKGIRVGGGNCFAVAFPTSLLQLWRLLEISIIYKKIIIIQAANTGLTGGSTPDGEDYDRDILIINTLHINKLILLNSGKEVLAFPGASLYQLEDKLSSVGRSPHSVIGSSCIGASVVGGVCNNSGGNLVNRGPSFTEASLFAQVTKEGNLELINHLDIDLGNSPEEIFENLELLNSDSDKINNSKKMLSDKEYVDRVRDVSADTPARFNSDKRRLFESSGCAGKLAVFAVRMDTFPLPEKEQVFFVGTNNPDNISFLREKILTRFKYLPDMGEYMHSSYFDAADKYCKDTFLFIKFFGTAFIPTLLFIKRKFDQLADLLPFCPNNFSDKLLQYISRLLPDHLPFRIRKFRSKFEHFLILLTNEMSIASTEELLIEAKSKFREIDYIKCSKSEGNDVLLHRYVCGGAPNRYQIVRETNKSQILPLDIALPRNLKSWHQILPPEILSQMDESFIMAHFLCMVFHWDFIVKKGVDVNALKKSILSFLDSIGAKYPAEHNVGHLYSAESSLKQFYMKLDPTNTFNSGIGRTSKNKFYT